jgi:hypothetical protein
MAVGRVRNRQRRDPKILPFTPRSPGEEFQTWGPDYDRPPIVATSWYPILRGKFLGTVTLLVPHWHVRITNCRLIRWGRGMRVFLPDLRWVNSFGKAHYTEIFAFDSDEEEREFGEAMLRAVRAMIAKMPDWPATEAEKALLREAEERSHRALKSRELRGYSTSGWEAVWRRVLVRDGFACRICGEKRGVLLCASVGDDDDPITMCRECWYLAQAIEIAPSSERPF